MKKLINFLFYILILNILISLLLVLDISSSRNNIQSDIVESLSNNDNYNLIVQILKDTSKEDFIRYIDYMQLDIDKNIENAPNDYIAFTIRLPQNKAFIAFYIKNKDNTYSFDSIVDNLDNIDGFYFYKDFLIVAQSCEDKTTYSNDKKFIEVFYQQGLQYSSKLKKDLYLEKIDLEGSEKIIISGSMDFLDDYPPQILYISTISTNDSNCSKDISKELYTWDNDLRQFTMRQKESPIRTQKKNF